MTTDTVEPLVAADFRTGVRGTDRPPGKGDLGMAMIFILPAPSVSWCSTSTRSPRLLLQLDQVQPAGDADNSSASTTSPSCSRTSCSGTRWW